MDKMFPYFMSIGMSFDEYWNGDPYLAQYYLKAQEIRERQKNTWLWLEGEYVFAAFSTALSNFHLDGKQHELNNYMQEPLQIFPETEQQIAQKEERKREELADRLRQMAKQFKDRNGEKNG